MSSDDESDKGHCGGLGTSYGGAKKDRQVNALRRGCEVVVLWACRGLHIHAKNNIAGRIVPFKA